jgi:2'-5'-oligoadenylate synthetase
MLGQLRSDFTLRPEAYKDLIELCASQDIKEGEFSICFTELQRNFIQTRPTKLKSLLRLIKHWYKQVSQRLLWPSWLLVFFFFFFFFFFF